MELPKKNEQIADASDLNLELLLERLDKPDFIQAAKVAFQAQNYADMAFFLKPTLKNRKNILFNFNDANTMADCISLVVEEKQIILNRISAEEYGGFSPIVFNEFKGHLLAQLVDDCEGAAALLQEAIEHPEVKKYEASRFHMALWKYYRFKGFLEKQA